MKEDIFENGKKKLIPTSDQFSQLLPIKDNNEKVSKNEKEIREILENDDYIKDLLFNPKSRFKNLITSDIIKILIGYCLSTDQKLDSNSPKDLRYPYYSLKLLCSDLILLFRKSVKNIKIANNSKINNSEIKDSEETQKINNINNNNLENSQSELTLIKTQEQVYQIPLNDEIFDDINNNNDYIIGPEDNYFNFKNELETEVNEKYVDLFKSPNSETELQKFTLTKKTVSEYDEEDQKIIKDILDGIFKVLGFDYNDKYTYIGYFQKIIIYLITNETDIIIDYLFKDTQPIIKKFYKHLNNVSIQNILENILNVISDYQDEYNKYKYQYNDIIQDLFNELKNDDQCEKSEYICQLIINTLINNTDKQLIQLFLKNNNIMITIKKLIEEKIKDKNNEKLIIQLMNLLCQLNNVILNSFYESSYFRKNYSDIDINVCLNDDDQQQMNSFECQYIPKNNISFKDIFDAYEENYISYLSIINDIYNIIKEDILDKFHNNNTKKLGIKLINEYKFIVSILKLYVYSYYAIEKFNSQNTKFFDDKKLFKISVKYYYYYPFNNLYQICFIDIIKLICNEKCPEYLVSIFLKVCKKEKRNKFLLNILKNLEKENQKTKNNLTSGTNLEILNIFYNSLNSTILQYFENNKLDKKIKEIFLKYVKSKFERGLDEDYEYSDSEIFNEDNNNDNTFDGNDSYIEREYDTIKKLIDKFLTKCKKANDINNDNNNDFNNGENCIKIINQKIKQKTKSNIIDSMNIINKENKTITEYINVNNFEICMKSEIILVEELVR